MSHLERPSVRTYVNKSNRLLREHGAKWCGKEYDNAAQLGDVQMIKYLLEAGCPKPSTNVACLNAAGNLEILKYLHENGFRWDGKLDDYDDVYDNNFDDDVVLPSQTLAFKAVQYQNLQCLKYILECGYELDTSDISLCNVAVSNNDVEMLKYLLDLGCKYNTTTILLRALIKVAALGECEPAILSAAARTGALDALKYLHEMGFEWDDSVTLLAAEFDRANILEYALKNGCGYSSLVHSVAASHGHLKCMKIAHKYGVPWTSNACRSAANGRGASHLKCLKYLHENGCPWSHHECTAAASNGNLKILKYAHENGCGWSKETWYAAVHRDSVKCLEYLYDNGCPQDLRTYTMMSKKECYAFLQKKVQKT